MTEARLDVWWMPVGTDERVLSRTMRWWELMQARTERREPQPLFHSALEVFVGDAQHLIEMAHAWRVPEPARGVVATGPVASAWLGRLRYFRYEVRCWSDGILHNRGRAVDSPVSFPIGKDDARSLLARVGAVPKFTWGRDAVGCGDMWSCNSLVSWLLSTAGIDATGVGPPGGGRAPGWTSGVAEAAGAGRIASLGSHGRRF